MRRNGMVVAVVGLALTACASAPAERAGPTTAAPSTVTIAIVPEPTSAPEPATVPVAVVPAEAPPPIDPEPTAVPAVAAPSEVAAAPVATVWPPYAPLPGVAGLAALTGLAAGPELESAAALVVKIDNHRGARPQWGLEAADLVVEENVEGITRFVAVFHSRQPPTIGPVRSARTSDLALVAALNRPILAWSGGNAGVTKAVRAAAGAGVLVDLSALRVGACFHRDGAKRKPHNLVLDPQCARDRAPTAGPARPPWTIDETWVSPAAYGPDATFDVPMDGVQVGWTWDPALGRYVRSQDGSPHLTMSGVRVAASNVLVLEVRHVPSRIDQRSPEAVTTGDGDGVLHRDGLATLVHWARVSELDAFTLTTRDGLPVAVDTGSTFVELTRAPGR